jgi:hypothetical protein
MDFLPVRLADREIWKKGPRGPFFFGSNSFAVNADVSVFGKSPPVFPECGPDMAAAAC